MTMPSFDNPCSASGDRLDFAHLGGTSTSGDPDSWYPELWSWLISRFNVRSVLDVGCGVGFSQRFFERAGVEATGIDCPQVLARHLLPDGDNQPHDFTEGGWFSYIPKNLVWCCEMAEHLEEKYSEYLVDTIAMNCDTVLAFCAAPEGAGGHHHVNCRSESYWIRRLEAAGFVHSPELTLTARSLCGVSNGRSPGNYFARSGLIFLTGLAGGMNR